MSLPMSSLCLRILVMHQNVHKTLYDTVSKMRHYVRTGLGNSSMYYCSNSKHNLQGGVQGNGYGPPTWLSTSIELLSSIASSPIQASFVSAISLTIFMMNVIMYVDDTDMFMTSEHNESPQSLKNKTQKRVSK